MIGGAILFTKGVPRERNWELKRLDEEATADNKIEWAVQLKQKGGTNIYGLKPSPTWSPEVHLVGLDVRQVLIPLIIRYPNPKPHCPSLLWL